MNCTARRYDPDDHQQLDQGKAAAAASEIVRDEGH
jgi:hypothetical protein